MRHHAALLFCAIFAAACGSRPAPIGPSTAIAAVSAGTQASAPPTITTWSCFTSRAAQFMGIFGSARIDASCASPRLTVESAADAAPSGPPTGLTGTTSGTTVTLMWTAAPSTPLIPVNSYVIEAGTSSGTSNTTTFDTGSTATTFTATGVPAGIYYVRVRARNGGGTGAASNEVVVIVGGGGCGSAPGAPSALGSTVTGSSVTLTWNAPSGGCAPTGYVIGAGSSSGSSDLAHFNTGSTATTFSAGGVPNGPYFVRVRAANSVGLSDASNEIIVIVGTPAAVSLTGRWVGLVANGEGATSTPNSCGVEKADLQYDLTQTGNDVTGTLTQTTRVSTCSGVGQAQMAPVTGTVSGGTFTFSINRPGSPHPGTATFTASRMTGRVDNGTSNGWNDFVVNKQ